MIHPLRPRDFSQSVGCRGTSGGWCKQDTDDKTKGGVGENPTCAKRASDRAHVDEELDVEVKKKESFLTLVTWEDEEKRLAWEASEKGKKFEGWWVEREDMQKRRSMTVKLYNEHRETLEGARGWPNAG